MPNRLAHETSPYLLQHKDNPVDWYPWGDEALRRARDEDKPILLSVGYSACHWCHVMEHESFADAGTAALMNEHFVSIKVDREERPDIDSLYMQAVQQMTGHGGWPMTVFLQPDGSAFYGGTYFPPEPRHGLPSFRQVLLGVHEAYQKRRHEVEESAASLREALVQGMSVNPDPGLADEEMLHRAFQGIASRFDAKHGGFGGAPKFPQPMILDFLLLYWAKTEDESALSMVERTLEKMAAGGIYDHLGGGFHRYSVDARWLVPHFEKMLYDNGLLAQTYLRAYQATGREDFRRISEEVLHYVEREMRSPEGAFYSSQDADSEGEEGRFYVWSADEIDSVLGKDDGALFRRYYGVTEGGNWEGKNILNVAGTIAESAAASGVSERRLEKVIHGAKERLYEIRGARVWPGRDEKVLTSWNAMMLHAFADAARILGAEKYTGIAVANAEFLVANLRTQDRLLRSWRDGSARIDAFLEDYALLADALISLYEATFDVRWVREARWLADRMIELFWSTEEELFYDTSSEAEALVLRPRDIYDNATPSGTSAAAKSLLRLARLTADTKYERIGSRVVAGMADVATRVPQAFGHLLGAVSLQMAPPTEVVIVGDLAGQDTRRLLDHLRGQFLPFTTVAHRPHADPEAAEALLPLVHHRELRGGAATAYVCRAYTCQQPVTSVDGLAEQLQNVLSD